MRTTDITGRDPFALARALDAFQTAARGKSSERVLVVSADDPAFAMPAAAWAAKAGDPVLFVHRDSVPQETKAALLAHDQPRIYILGPPSTVSASVATELKKLGTVKRLGADNPIDNAIAFARYSDPTFGWGVVDPGHGLVFARSDRPLDAAAASPLSVSGSYGPLLLLASPTGLDGAVGQYLLDIQPGYTRDPVRGVYNHGWIVGDDRAISVATQARIDSLLEITQGPDQPGAVQQPVSEAESPIRKAPDHEVTVEDVRQLMGASTPHFALQIRNRIARLIAGAARGPPRADRGRARDRAPREAGLRRRVPRPPRTRTASCRCPRWTTTRPSARPLAARVVPSCAPVSLGREDIDRAAQALASRVPPPLHPLARAAYNLRWSWTPGGARRLPRRRSRSAGSCAARTRSGC